MSTAFSLCLTRYFWRGRLGVEAHPCLSQAAEHCSRLRFCAASREPSFLLAEGGGSSSVAQVLALCLWKGRVVSEQPMDRLQPASPSDLAVFRSAWTVGCSWASGGVRWGHFLTVPSMGAHFSIRSRMARSGHPGC